MAAKKDVDLTGIDNINEYYTNHFFRTLFGASIQGTIAARGAAAKQAGDLAPWSRLQQAKRHYFRAREQMQRSPLRQETQDAIAALAAEYLAALGYPALQPIGVTIGEGAAARTVPVALECRGDDGRPCLWVLLAAATDEAGGILEGTVFGDTAAPHPGEENEALVSRIFFEQSAPPRWLIFIGARAIALLDREAWNAKRYLSFDLDAIFGQSDDTALQAMTVLLHHDSVVPQGAANVLDQLRDASEKNAEGVSDDLKYALRESIELLGNEVLAYYRAHPESGVRAEGIDADELTIECLRYMYRMLFVLFIESRTDLGYAPMKAAVYATGYSLESLRDVAERSMHVADEHVLEGTYLYDSLGTLFTLMYQGYPATEDEQQRYRREESLHDTFLLPPLKAHIFDPDRTPLLRDARLRNRVLLRILQEMSLTKAHTKNERRRRISYANLGINQMGAVYEALLSYRGFIAQETLYEVKRKDDKTHDELSIGYFVPQSELGDYDEDMERVRDADGRLRRYERGTFIYRLAGREREKSASYYTPEVLTRCLVKYALKELLKGKSADDILSLTICEPAMGSAAFLNEAISQLAEAYLAKRQEERHERIPYKERARELQKVKMYIADRNVYGVDLNPTAVELAEVSLWLNTIYAGGFVPWFGTQLVCGNSLIGARRECYRVEELQTKTRNMHWYDLAPKRVPLGGEKRQPTKQVYHFLTGDPGMANYKDKVIKGLAPEAMEKIKDWSKRFSKPYTDDEIANLLLLSKAVDRLWEQQVELREEIERATRDTLSIYGHEDTGVARHMTIRAKDEVYRKIYRSEHMKNAGPYARLRFAMDYWCALWFWPIDQADLLPERYEFLAEMSFILEGAARTMHGDDYMKQMNLFNAATEFSLFANEIEMRQSDMAEEFLRCYPNETEVDLDMLCEMNPRLALVREIAKKHRFLHWELEFADVFARNGGMSLMVGNPPWVLLGWNEQSVLADANPRFAIKNLSAKQTADERAKTIENVSSRQTYFEEYVTMSGQQNFLNATTNYPLLRGQKTNLYKCFLPMTLYNSEKNGIVALVHPNGVYDDAKGGLLRQYLYPHLRTRFMFTNEKKLFKEIHNEVAYCLNVYGASQPVNFDVINNLLLPITIEECYHGDSHKPMPKIKKMIPDRKKEEWNTEGHPHRILHINKKDLKMFTSLFDSHGEWKFARLPALYAQEFLDVLRVFDAQVKVNSFAKKQEVYTTECWNETNAQYDGTMQSEVNFPESIESTIYSSSFINVANPLFATSQRIAKSNRSQDGIDLTDISEDYRPRCKYQPACMMSEYQKRAPMTPWKKNFLEEYRLANREMVGCVSERTLAVSILPPGVAFVNTVFGVAYRDESLIPLMAGLESSLPYDFLVRVIGKGHVNNSTTMLFPIVHSKYDNAIKLRALLLNCLTKYYADLWHRQFDDAYTKDMWAQTDERLNPARFTSLTDTWTWDTPLRTDFERREALVELDVLTALALGLTLEELQTIYRIQFPVLQSYEAETYYDANGRIVYTNNRGMSGTDAKGRKHVGVSTKEWTVVQHLKPGETYDHTYTDDTHPGGPRERTITYRAPFTKCDREKDYEAVWRVFSERA